MSTTLTISGNVIRARVRSWLGEKHATLQIPASQSNKLGADSS
jgi:hypothetical protein